ncbi:E3 ubiquitin-protein ligase-like [Hoplias malabaricus]|uniref:E3 ubiquitin-protein ligase-like n=1 Tax=Hoplias malabaricus TaxID=27720 RepID=UPI00346210FB
MPGEQELELECGICYGVYNATTRCPRLLSCGHRFCESCLLRQGSVVLPAESGTTCGVVCALCRRPTPLQVAELRECLPRDLELLQMLTDSGNLPCNASEDEEDEEPETHTSGHGKDQSLPSTRRVRLWRTVKKLCRKIRGQNRAGCITDAEVRDLALMSCYMI